MAMRKPTSALRPTLPARPKLPSRTNIASPKRPPVPGSPSKTTAAPKTKLGKGIEGVSQALEIHRHIADAAINSQNIVTPAAALVSHTIERHTGLNNVYSAAQGGGLRHRPSH